MFNNDRRDLVYLLAGAFLAFPGSDVIGKLPALPEKDREPVEVSSCDCPAVLPKRVYIADGGEFVFRDGEGNDLENDVYFGNVGGARHGYRRLLD